MHPERGKTKMGLNEHTVLSLPHWKRVSTENLQQTSYEIMKLKSFPPDNVNKTRMPTNTVSI